MPSSQKRRMEGRFPHFFLSSPINSEINSGKSKEFCGIIAYPSKNDHLWTSGFVILSRMKMTTYIFVVWKVTLLLLPLGFFSLFNRGKCSCNAWQH